MTYDRSAKTQWVRGFLRISLALILAAATSLSATASDDLLDPALFPIPANLEPNVAFWTSVYTEHPSVRALLHDERYLNIVYTVIDFSKLANLPDAVRAKRRRQQVDDVKEHYTAILQNLAAGRPGPEALANEYGRVRGLFANVPGGASKYTDAVDRLRSQTCLSNRFAEGVARSGVYMPEIERIFARQGLPKALTRLPFVESLFQTGAHSKASAAGIWQFMPSTARLYLKMDVEYDERYDPLRATEAAARHLAGNYKALGTWPLALTAYNHGRAGMKRAVSRVGTRDLGVIVDTYSSRTFGFASRNFYSEFIAATRAYEHRDRHFPGVEPLPALAFEPFVAKSFVSVPALAQATDTDLNELRTMNPGISPAIWSNDLFLPKDYVLRVPTGAKARFDQAVATLDGNQRSDRQRGFYYRVRRGDTLGTIAAKHGTSVRAVQQANKLRSVNVIGIGQTLYIPPGRRSGPPPRATRPAVVATSTPIQTPAAKTTSVASKATKTTTVTESSYTVQAGDTLSTIAERHGTSVEAVRVANGLGNADHIVVGQRLRLTGAKRTHQVRRGDTLTSIARRYGTTVSTLKVLNRIRSHVIHPAQVLIIP